jgi:RNA-binding protein 8A
LVRMANTAEAEAVDFEPEDDDLMDEDGGVDAADASASPRAPLPKLKSAITGGASSSAAAAASRKIKGRGFRQDHPDTVDRSARLAASNFDSLKSPDGPGPQRC